MQKIMKLICAAALFTAALTPLAHAKAVDKVVAVINDNIITQSDLNARFELVMRGLSKNPSRDEQRLLLYRTLNSMIDESLIQQYARKRGYNVRRADIAMAINRFEKSRGLPEGAYAKITAGVESAAEQQIVSDLILDQIVERDLRSRVNIPNSEVDQLIRQLGASNSRTEWEVAQIFIPVSEADGGEDNAESLAKSAYERAQTETDFAAVAKDYNTSGTPLDGYLGWFGEGEMVPVLEEEIRKLAVGEISAPVRSGTGYHILHVKNTRSLPSIQTQPITEYKLQKNTFTKDAEPTTDELWVSAQDLSTHLKTLISTLDVGETSKKMSFGEDQVSYTLLDTRKTLPEGLDEYRMRVRNRLMESRLDLAIRRMMRDLRRDAFIDIRI